MSSRLVGLVLEHYPTGGGEFVLAIALADEAAHSGGNVRATISEMARLSRQSIRQVRRLLRKMESSGWLQCLTHSEGGRSKGGYYQINPEWVSQPLEFEFAKPGHNPDILSGFKAAKPGQNVRVSDPTPLFLKALPPIVPQNAETSGSAVPSATAPDDTDLKLARWIHGLLLSLNPKQRTPPWKRWSRDIRVMVNAGHSHHDIAALFKYANDDRIPRPGSEFCWANVILSPGKLWRQWDALMVKRGADPNRKLAGAEIDPHCAICHARPWSMQLGKTGARVCGPCYDADAKRAA